MKPTVLAVLVSFAALVVAVVALGFRPAATAPRDGCEAGLQKLEGKLDSVASSLRDTDARLTRLHADLTALAEAVDRPDQDPGKARSTATRRGRAARIPQGVMFHDTFEKDTCGWFVVPFAPLIIGKVARTTEEGSAREGRGALSLSYTLKPNTLAMAYRTCIPVNRLSFWIRATQRPADLYVGAHERDDSDYGTTVRVEPDEGWKHMAVDLGTLALGDDSQDENARLDFDQISGVFMGDISAFQGGVGPNVLLIDEVIGEYHEPEDEAGNVQF
jgi:outer membrane murein-binding lipoprotein Lpp